MSVRNSTSDIWCYPHTHTHTHSSLLHKSDITPISTGEITSDSFLWTTELYRIHCISLSSFYFASHSESTFTILKRYFLTVMILGFIEYTPYIQFCFCRNNNNIWIKIDQLDVTCFIISIFTAQHVSNVSTSIFRSLRLIVDLFHVLYCSGSMCIGVKVWYPYAG